VPCLYLLRHAKSAWDTPGLDDRNRPLAPRGRKAVRKLAEHVDHEAIRPELVLCSPALRTRQTIAGLEQALGSPPVRFEERIYEASPEGLLGVAREIADGVGSTLMVGHNPGTALLIELLAGAGLPRPAEVPTGALATLSFDGPWAELAAGAARLDAFVVPRDLP
jgi:phosphohistidine phosphatase